jgi:hypothetical protein
MARHARRELVLIHEHPADVLLPQQRGLVLAVNMGDRLDIRRCVRCIVSNVKSAACPVPARSGGRKSRVLLPGAGPYNRGQPEKRAEVLCTGFNPDHD